jgi:hypothetical protein
LRGRSPRSNGDYFNPLLAVPARERGTEFAALTAARARWIIRTMVEHWFLAAMLAFVVLQVAAVAVIAHKVFRRSERIDALTAATYLEARKALSQSR